MSLPPWFASTIDKVVAEYFFKRDSKRFDFAKSVSIVSDHIKIVLLFPGVEATLFSNMAAGWGDSCGWLMIQLPETFLCF